MSSLQGEVKKLSGDTTTYQEHNVTLATSGASTQYSDLFSMPVGSKIHWQFVAPASLTSTTASLKLEGSMDSVNFIEVDASLADLDTDGGGLIDTGSTGAFIHYRWALYHSAAESASTVCKLLFIIETP